MSLPSPIRRWKAGRPMKHIGGWEMDNRRICISKDTYAEWRRLCNELDLRNDDSVALYLVVDQLTRDTETTTCTCIMHYRHYRLGHTLHHALSIGTIANRCSLSFIVYVYFVR